MDLIKRLGSEFIVFVMIVSVVGVSLLLDTQEAFAMTIKNEGSNKAYKSGSFTVKIKDAEHADSSLKVSVSKETAPSFTDMVDKATKWNVALSGTNNHGARLTGSTVTTKKDINGEYRILNIGMTYTLSAHSKYVSGSVNADKAPDCRMDFKTYSQMNDKGTNTANVAHGTGNRTVTLNLQVNTSCAGLITHAQKRYTGCTMSFGVARSSYDLKTKHWAQGFRKGDLNASLANTDPASVNANRNSLVLRQSTVSGSYKCCTNVDPRGFALSSPKGYQLKEEMYTNAITGTSSTHPLGAINMGTKNQSVSLYQTPISYTIAYDLAGGTNNAANPKTYTICDPVTFAAPTKADHKFLGWYEGNARVTGINQGKSNGVLTTSNFYSQMNARTIGNKTLTAKWDAPPSITAPVVNGRDNNKVTPFVKTIGGKETLVIQKGDKFTAQNYQTTQDKEDGDLTGKTIVEKNIPLEGGCATKPGTYEVIYRVADSSGLTATRTITVLVNDPPKPVVYERYFFKNQEVTKTKLFEQVRIDDKEDGTNTLPKSNKVISIDNDTGKTELDTSKDGIYKVKYVTEDSLKGEEVGEFTVNVVEDIQETNSKSKRYPRFIDQDSISSLQPDSIWLTDMDHHRALLSSLENETPIKSYELQ